MSWGQKINRGLQKDCDGLERLYQEYKVYNAVGM